MKTLSTDDWSLVTENLRLVYSTANQMRAAGQMPPHLLDDAVSEGIYGLIKAAALFEPERGVRFSTFAVVCIRNQIRCLLSREWSETRMYGISLDDEMSVEGSHYADALTNPEELQFQDAIWLKETMQQTLERNGIVRQAQLLMEHAAGKTMTELATERGVTKQYISKQIGLARKALREAMNRADWTS